MFKKLVASIVSLAIMLSCSCSVFAESFINRFLDEEFVSIEEQNKPSMGEETVSTTQQYDILQKLLFELDILDSEKGLNLKAEASYDDFINAISNILGICDITSDVNDRFEYLKNNHVVLSETKPKYVSMKELINAAFEITGYGEVYRSKGLDPLKIAIQKDLIHNVKYHEENATNAEMAQVLFNILSVESITVVGVKDNYLIFDTTDTKTILERKYNTKLYRGVLTAAGITGLYSNTELGENEVELDGVKYDSISDLNFYVGQKVTAFISYSKDYIRPTVLAAEPYNNTTIKFTKESIEGYSESKISYKNSSEKKVYVNVSESTKIICNNVFYSSYSKPVFASVLEGDSEIVWIDNNNDNVADVLVIWEYKHYPTLYAAGKSGRITFKYDMLFNGLNYIDTVSDKDIKVIVCELDNAGREVEMPATDIKQGEVVSIAASKNSYGKKYAKIIVSSNTVTDKFVSIDNDEGIWETESENSYIFAKEFSDVCGFTDTKKRSDIVTPEMGESYKLYLAFNGKIADVTTSEDLPWGVLVTCDPGSRLTLAQAKIFDGKNMQLFNMAKKIKYYDENSTNGEKIDAKVAVDRINALNPEDPRYLIRYELDGEKNITSIYMPVDRTNESPGQFDYPNTIAFSGSGRFYGSMIDTTYSVNPKNSVLFNIPSKENASIDEEYYTSGFNKQTEYTIEGLTLHNVDKYYICPVGLTVGVAKELSNDLPTGVVDRVVYTTNEDDEDICRVFCYLSGPSANPNQGSYTNLDFELDEISSIENYYPSQIPVTSLKFGDIIQVEKSSTGLIAGFRVLQRLDESVTDFCVRDKDGAKIEGNPGFMQPVRMTYLAKYLGSKDDMILVDVGVNGAERILPVRYFAYNYLTLIDREEQTISVIARSDVSVGDTIFAVRRYAGILSLVVIR